MYQPPLSNLVKIAINQLHTSMAQTNPFMAEQVGLWMSQLSGDVSPEHYFLHPSAYPMLLLPWWCDETYQPTPNLALQTSLVYSTINGYYYIRLIDNLMDDRQAETERQLLPALNFFHTEFLTAYHAHFPMNHPFWQHFKTIWFYSAEVTIRDAQLRDIDLDLFKHVVAQKLCAAKIPIVAVCYNHHRPELITPWFELIDLLSCWHQMFNDLFDWHTDSAQQIQTYFLSEGQRRKKPTESIAAWVSREGFAWGSELMHTWMAELQSMAKTLGNDNLVNYLAERETLFTQREQDALKGLKSIAQLLHVFS